MRPRNLLVLEDSTVTNLEVGDIMLEDIILDQFSQYFRSPAVPQSVMIPTVLIGEKFYIVNLHSMVLIVHL